MLFGVSRAHAREHGVFGGEQLLDVALQPFVHDQAVASTLGNGGTSSSHSPARRDCLSTSTRRWSATRTVVARRCRPTRMWNTDSAWFFSTVRGVSTSTAAMPVWGSQRYEPLGSFPSRGAMRASKGMRTTLPGYTEGGKYSARPDGS